MKRRHRRSLFMLLTLSGVAIALWLTLKAFNQNMVFYFTPTQVAAKEVPVGRRFRIGGLVEDGSLQRYADGLTSRFTLTDTVKGISIVYKGLLPDLFKEGRGCVAQGVVGSDGNFYADQVLAKHDENYMPPAAAQAIQRAKESSGETR